MRSPIPARAWREPAPALSARRHVLRSGALVALAAVLAPVPGHARARWPRARQVRGTAEGLDGDVLVVRTNDGAPFRVRPLPHCVFARVEAYPRTDIAPGDVVNAFAMPGAAGRLVAVALSVYPQGARGRRQADVHVGWGHRRDTTRTLSPVIGAERAADGGVLHLTLRWRRQVLEVPPDAFVATTRPTGRDAIVPGAIVSALAFVDQDGSFITSQIVVGDAALPPVEVAAENRWRDP